MKKTTFALLAICMVFALNFTGCKPPPDDNTKKSLKELIQGKTWKLGTVRKGSVDVTSDFTGFTMSFDGAAGAGSITTGGTSSQTVSVTYNVEASAIGLTGTRPTNWPATLTSASSNEPDGTTFTFTVNINNPKTGAADHVFNLIKQ